MIPGFAMLFSAQAWDPRADLVRCHLATLSTGLWGLCFLPLGPAFRPLLFPPTASKRLVYNFYRTAIDYYPSPATL